MGESKNKIINGQDKLGPGAYISLILIIVFFSGVMGRFDNWLSFFDYTTLSGKFGEIGETAANFQGSGGDGAKGGFMFAFGLIPGVMLAIGSVAVAEYYGAIKASQKLLTPLLRPLLGIPGNTGLAMITSLQSTDASATMTKLLKDDGSLTENQATVFCAWMFSSDATITNFFSTGAALWALTNADGNAAIRISMMIPFILQLIMKFFGANIVRFYIMRKNKANEEVVKNAEINSKAENKSAAVEKEQQEKRNPTVVFVDGAKRGLNIGLTSIIPNVLMAYVLIKILNVTGLMDVVGTVLSPVMAVFGLPGQASTVLLGSFLSMGGGVGVAGALFTEGVLTGAHLAILSPAIFLMGSLLQYSGRLLAVVRVKNQGLLFAVSILNAFVAMLIMNILV
ncbi:MAG: nucleoside recognition domain-containing protein [Dysgonamonadaceae bacterium]|nr:nucleoside recognition domain-containing protein [Dysgonamonadaceae bacterium]